MENNNKKSSSTPVGSWADWFDRAAEVFDDPRMKIAYYRDGDTGEPYSYDSMKITYCDLWDKLKPNPTDTVLDVGCGVGFFEKTYANQVKSIVGTDIALHMITSAYQLNPNGTFLVCNAESQPFKDNQFDRILCYGVTQYLPSKTEIKTMLNEFVRISRNNARIVIGDILEPAEEASNAYKKQSPRGKRWWPESLDHSLTKLYLPREF